MKLTNRCHKLRTRILAGAFAALCLVGANTLTPLHAWGYDERKASNEDSDAQKWSVIKSARYGDVIRKTDRITYPDAGNVPPSSCNLVGNSQNELIFGNPKTSKVAILDYIPYGSDSEEVSRSIDQQPEIITINAPAGATDFGKHVSCVFNYRDSKPALAISGGNKTYLYTFDGKTPQLDSTFEFAAPVDSLSGISPDATLGNGEFVVSSDSQIYRLQAPTAPSAPDAAPLKAKEVAQSIWSGPAGSKLKVFPVGYALGLSSDVPSIAVGDPTHGNAYLIKGNRKTGELETNALKIESNAPNSEFGTSISSVGDQNQDGIGDFAIGAPGANSDSGAVAIIYGKTSHKKPVTVDLAALESPAVVTKGEKGGVLLRKPTRGRFGSSVAYIPGGKEDGALLVGRPVDEEHPGALIISDRALKEDRITGLGVDGIESSMITTLAADDDKSGSGGTTVGVVASTTDFKLSGLYTVDKNGKVDVWTVDMSRQSDPQIDKEPETKPVAPKPADPTADKEMDPLDTPDKKIWVGEYSQGLGGALARGCCDVTGDGKPDIISGNVVRSEWKYDPFYADTTPTKGWVHNVTGAIQIIPGGTPGQTLPSDQVITILGPKKTQDPAIDASIGLSVACLGDTNGDGIDDFAFGSHTMSKVWVLYGGKDLAKVNLDALKPEQGWSIDLPENGSPAFQIEKVGDLNGDGLNDLGFIVSNASYAVNGSGAVGSAFVISGKKNSENLDFLTLPNDHERLLVRIDSPEEHTLTSFATVGDVNGDGVTDYVIADGNQFSMDADYNFYVPGHAWVVYGKPLKAGQPLLLKAGTASEGYEIVTPIEASYRVGMGNAIVPVGDVNADGFGDFLLGFDGGVEDNAHQGGVALIHGTDQPVQTMTIDPKNKVNDPRADIVLGNQVASGFGYAVDFLPVKEGNPKAQVAVGAQAEGEGGKAYLFNLEDIPHGVTPVTSLKSVKTIDSTGKKARFGRAVAFVCTDKGCPALAVGGDAVDDAGENYANTAHIMTMRVGECPKPSEKPTPVNPSPTPSEKPDPGNPSPTPSEKPDPGKPSPTPSEKPDPGKPSPSPSEKPDPGKPSPSPKPTASNKPTVPAKPSATPKPVSPMAKTGTGSTFVAILALVLLASGVGALGIRQHLEKR